MQDIGENWHAYVQRVCCDAWRFMGAHVMGDGQGVRFSVYAPDAARVSVVGDWNGWTSGVDRMTPYGDTGIWWADVDIMAAGQRYKYAITPSDTGGCHLKSDPFARQFEYRPGDAGCLVPPAHWQWQDASWMRARAMHDPWRSPVSIYELHAGSWHRESARHGYRRMAHRLVEHVSALGFTHVQFLPLTEHLLDESWGYLVHGYFAPSSRFGCLNDFRYLVDTLHAAGIGVLVDWVPGHFPRDAAGLARFCGMPLYEYPDPRRGEHRGWGTLVFDYGRRVVRNFLLSSADFWLGELHVDGLRVDAVASMLYLDYDRPEGHWLPNEDGSHTHREAVGFLQELNTWMHARHPGVLMIAEESTAWSGVTRPVHADGLGFGFKWNLGWMHDTLAYLSRDPIHRRYHHAQFSFSRLYAFSEHFVLPLSHDEVVHGKGSLLSRMPGDEWQRFANMRLLYAAMFMHPGKKLLFMGNEWAPFAEWSIVDDMGMHESSATPLQQGIFRWIAALNRVYVELPGLHASDCDAQGFEWLDCHDAEQSIFSFMRGSSTSIVVIVMNFTPVVRHDYRLAMPTAGAWRECLNSDSEEFGGSGVVNRRGVHTDELGLHGRRQSLMLSLPPLGISVWIREDDDERLVGGK